MTSTNKFSVFHIISFVKNLLLSLTISRMRNPWIIIKNYSIVKDSSADLGVNFKIVQNRPTFKAVCTKISKKFFAYLSIFHISERK